MISAPSDDINIRVQPVHNQRYDDMAALSNLSYDIIVEIAQAIRFSSLADCCSFGSTNRAIRDAAIPLIFEKIRYGSPSASFAAIIARYTSPNLPQEPVVGVSRSLTVKLRKTT